jgi:hypothetical protein
VVGGGCRVGVGVVVTGGGGGATGWDVLLVVVDVDVAGVPVDAVGPQATTNIPNDTARSAVAKPRRPIRTNLNKLNKPDTAVSLPSRRCAVLARGIRPLVDLRYSYAAGRWRAQRR